MASGAGAGWDLCKPSWLRASDAAPSLHGNSQLHCQSTSVMHVCCAEVTALRVCTHVLWPAQRCAPDRQLGVRGRGQLWRLLRVVQQHVAVLQRSRGVRRCVWRPALGCSSLASSWCACMHVLPAQDFCTSSGLAASHQRLSLSSAYCRTKVLTEGTCTCKHRGSQGRSNEPVIKGISGEQCLSVGVRHLPRLAVGPKPWQQLQPGDEL